MIYFSLKTILSFKIYENFELFLDVLILSENFNETTVFINIPLILYVMQTHTVLIFSMQHYHITTESWFVFLIVSCNASCWNEKREQNAIFVVNFRIRLTWPFAKCDADECVGCTKCSATNICTQIISFKLRKKLKSDREYHFALLSYYVRSLCFQQPNFTDCFML